MYRLPSFAPGLVGIESVRALEILPVSRVDVMTRNPDHAAILEAIFGVRPFRFARPSETVYAFSRLPAASARAWLEDRGLPFELTAGGLKRADLETWVQGGFENS